MSRSPWIIITTLLLLLALAACSAGAPDTEAPAKEEEAAPTQVESVMEPEEPAAEAEEEVQDEAPAQPTTLPPSPTALSTAPLPTTTAPPPTPLVEARLVEVEWPESLFLGDSDVVRMALVPSESGVTLTTEFPDHSTTTQDVPVVRPAGYDLTAVGRLDGVGFRISPAVEQASALPLDQPVIWHWSLTPEAPGKQRLTVQLLLRWEPQPGTAGDTREAVAYSKGLEMRVRSFFGLTRAQALYAAFAGLAIGGCVILFAAFSRGPGVRKRPGKTAQIKGRDLLIQEPNSELKIEAPAGLSLADEERNLLQALFAPYRRLLIQREFLSGYSGARTFMLIPIRRDGRRDAPAIAKLGPKADIQREYHSYQTFVRRTLPPITARIQSLPVALKTGARAALQYTFVGQGTEQPLSLRQALLDNPDPRWLETLFETFGPNWWMQRSPRTFRAAAEVDRLLPPHWLVEPVHLRNSSLQGSKRLDGRQPPGSVELAVGEIVVPSRFNINPGDLLTPGRAHLTLYGETAPGHPPLRLRWLNTLFPRSAVGQVTGTRLDLLRAYVAGFDLHGLPDPIEQLPARLNETIASSHSIIHGDLNLENILIGPGGMVWLIDFAATREGPPLLDFAHLEAEIIAHIIAPQLASPADFLPLWDSAIAETSTSTTADPLAGLLTTLHKIAFNCLANPTHPREYYLILYFTCLGALKYRNLSPHQKHLLYLTAAAITQHL